MLFMGLKNLACAGPVLLVLFKVKIRCLKLPVLFPGTDVSICFVSSSIIFLKSPASAEKKREESNEGREEDRWRRRAKKHSDWR